MSREQRKLAAIVSADVVGYTRLMEGDEAGTHARLQDRLAKLVRPNLESHGGRVVKFMGDGMLAEFSSVVDAVQAAIKIQGAMSARNAEESVEQQVQYRVGVNLGDVIVEGDDLFGEGVNLAVRLQEIASAGGICLSDDACRQVRGKIDAAFRDGGEASLKNIALPVHVWHWSATPATPDTAIALGESQGLSVPDKPSIAVLPFDNMSGDGDQEYFSDGITEDIITNLSHIRWLFVIARNSSFTFKGKAVDVRNVAKEFGVRYVLEGSVRKSGSKVRITAQLIDAATSANLWAERYDRDLTDIFAVQDEITQSVAAAIEPEILAAEGLRVRTGSDTNLNAWDLVMRALATYWRISNKDSLAAIGMLETAVEKYPDYGPAHSMLAFALLFAGHVGWRTLDAERDRAQRLARRAAEIDDQDAWAHIALGYMNAVNRERDEAVTEFGKAIALNSNFAAAYGYRGFTNAHAGRAEEALPDLELALRLSPKDPQNAIFNTAAGVAHYLAGRYQDAAIWAEEGTRIRPGFTGSHRVHCAALAQAGRLEEARASLRRIQKLQPDVSATLLSRSLPYSSPEALQHFIDGLRKAGLPE